MYICIWGVVKATSTIQGTVGKIILGCFSVYWIIIIIIKSFYCEDIPIKVVVYSLHGEARHAIKIGLYCNFVLLTSYHPSFNIFTDFKTLNKFQDHRTDIQQKAGSQKSSNRNLEAVKY